MNRRKFIGFVFKAALGAACSGAGYGVMEAKWLRVERITIPLRNLAPEFAGTTIAFLSDIHHGPFVPLSYVKHAVATANALHPDVVALGGDYVHQSRDYARPCLAELGKLRAKIGRFAVLGNHDHYHNGRETAKQALRDNGLPELTNCGAWLRRGRARLWICGVGDLWRDKQDLSASLQDATTSDAVILLSHNPDYVERIRDPRVGLVLSGHTHGGQVSFPVVGAPVVPSHYGQKYAHGVVQGPVAKAFVTRGVGTITPPVRFCCRPEIALITLV